MNPCEICTEPTCDTCCMGREDYDQENDRCKAEGECKKEDEE